MLGLFNTLQLGARALQANQLGVEVTGQNLANSSNAAYSRQRVMLSTSLPTPTGLGMQGTGVQVTSIQQIRDAMLDGEMRDESSVSGYWNSQQSSLENAQTQLGEFLNINSTSGSSTSGLSDQLNNLFNSFQSVATDPTSIPQREDLVNQAETLASGLNQASQQFSTLNSSLNTSVSNNVTAANQLLSQIAALNGQIAKATAAGGNANDLNDTREQDLENLSNLVNIQTTTNTNGTVDVSVGGAQLVSGGQTLDTLQAYDPGSGQLLVRTATGGTPLTLTGGAIQGTIDARDGALQTLRSGLDTIASSLITQVNGVYSAGYDLNGGTGQPLFTGTDAGTIGVNSALQTDPSLVQAAGAAGASGDNSVALQLAQLGQQSLSGLGNQTFSGAFASQVGTFGFALSNANAQADNASSVTGMLQNQRDSVSGVSIEEEVANLITFQQAYTASSKIITTVDQMLQTVMSLKT
ncbi:MAG TPA: flagellar hook-associated protein FlgK [Verrucomicrobiae bacterium]|jgi:flagellar hook-associated protein 1 FlgK|nr:flagellar hook-associated protein FlgK [Verrucomicrobiae bacterium]